MTTNRSYRRALSYEEAYKRIIEGSGTQFDPYVVELFKKVYPDWVKQKHKIIEHPMIEELSNMYGPSLKGGEWINENP